MLERALERTLEEHVLRLARYVGERGSDRPESLERAAATVEEAWAAAGLSPRRETFTAGGGGSPGVPGAPSAPGAGGREYRNLIVETEDIRPGRPFLILGAHYDTAPGTPGADDNASGVAVLLELSKALRGADLPVPVRFAAFANEEPPWFPGPEMGSAHHAREARRKGERVAGMLSLEMLGYYDDRPGSQRYPPLLSRFFPEAGDFLGLVSDFSSRRFLRRMESGLRAGGIKLESAWLPRWVPGVALSDHACFWREGFPAAMLTDTAMFRNPNYHRPTDLPETLDYARMAEAVRALESTLRAWR